VKKLIIQIPCFNEAENIANTLAQLPRQVAGYDVVEWLIVDDGSSDGTVDAARAGGVDHVVALGRHLGLAGAFLAGVQRCLRLGADTIVNTDADNQYDASCIADLVAPILDETADIVIGSRPIGDNAEFSGVKKLLQRAGSWAVRVVSGTDVPDAPSGFRAFHRTAAMRLQVFSAYTYTLEMIIQAGLNNMRIISVPIRTNGYVRPSRLVESNAGYVVRSVATILRIFLIYRPFLAFLTLSALFLFPAFLLGMRYLWVLYTGVGGAHIQSLILASILSVAGFVSLAIAVVADLLSVNRKLLEDIRVRLLERELGRDDADDEIVS
jgi:glycosyltransferase involved in cell wall biosynthesis